MLGKQGPHHAAAERVTTEVGTFDAKVVEKRDRVVGEIAHPPSGIDLRCWICVSVATLVGSDTQEAGRERDHCVLPPCGQ